MRIWPFVALVVTLTVVLGTLLQDRGAPIWAAFAVTVLAVTVLAVIVPLPPRPRYAVAVVDRDGGMEMAGTEVYGERFDAVIRAVFAAAEEKGRGGRRRYVVVQLRESGRTL
jgi:hypothetical protein